MTLKISSTQADYEPICPYCEKEIDEVHWRQIDAMNAEYVFMCPTCRKVLGVGVRKAAWIS